VYLLSVILAICALAAQQTPTRDGPPEVAKSTAVVRGRVVTADSGVPVRDCLVRVWQESGADAKAARTAADGRFELIGLAPGLYRVMASPTTTHASYLPSGVRQPGATESPRVIELAAGQTLDGLEIRLVRAAAIGGSVIDDRGEPVAFIDVRLGRQRDGLVEWVSSPRPSMTDDRGRFRLSGLMPGTYVLVAEPISAGSTAHTTDQTWYVRTFYPSQLDQSTSEPIVVAAGQELDGIALRLLRGRMHHIRGRVLDSRGQPAAGASGQIFTPQVAHPLRILSDGSYVASDLPPGRYSLRASLRTGPPPGAIMELGAAIVEITDADVEDVPILLQPAASVSGTVVFAAPAPPAAYDDIRIRASPFPRETGFGDERLGAAVNRSGAFTLANLHGPVLIRPEAGEWILEGVRLGESDITDTPTDFGSAGHRRLVVTLGRGGSEVSGSVTRDGRPEPGVSVLIFSQDRAFWDYAFTTTRTAHTNPGGRYTVRGLRPGRYYATAALSTGPAEPPAYFDRLAPSAVPFELGPEERVTIDLILDDPFKR
jgi:protocatechuate 3,4-dioxygenase beta subunit